MGTGRSEGSPIAQGISNIQDRAGSLHTLANNTDGIAVIANNDLKVGLQKISDEPKSYYLLGYYSTNRKFDGKYREKPDAAGFPESGTEMTRSASTGASRQRISPIRRPTGCSTRPSSRLSGRGEEKCSKAQCDFLFRLTAWRHPRPPSTGPGTTARHCRHTRERGSGRTPRRRQRIPKPCPASG